MVWSSGWSLMSVSLIKLIHKLAWILPPATSCITVQWQAAQESNRGRECDKSNCALCKNTWESCPGWLGRDVCTALHQTLPCTHRCTSALLVPSDRAAWCGGSCDDAILLVFCVTPLIECGVFNIWLGAELRLWGDDETLHCIHYTLHLDTVERVTSATEYQAWFFGFGLNEA